MILLMPEEIDDGRMMADWRNFEEKLGAKM